jgi:hypothetical protein
MDIELLYSERLASWGARLKFPAEAVDALQAVASQVRSDSELLAIFTEFHEPTALRGEWHRDWSDLPVDPRVQARLNERTSLFYLLGYMAALPYTEARYRQLGVGMDVFFETMRDFLNYLGDFYDLYGYWGYANFAWIWRHLTCELFRLGRLQYMLAPFYNGVTAFRRKSATQGGVQEPERVYTSDQDRVLAVQKPDGNLSCMDILLLADPDQPLRLDGYAYGAGKTAGDDVTQQEVSWKPAYEESAAGWRGHVISPYGWVHPQAVFLPRTEWDLILQSGDTVLDLHIPREDPLTAETCSHSLRQAFEFFPRFFPERPWKAVYCHTWFFSPQLQQILPPDSSIVKFQREFYLYPFAGSVGFLWDFVFGKKYPDPTTAPRDTSLRRAVLDWLDRGKVIFDLPGVMFHAPEAWGSQPYMSQWDTQESEIRYLRQQMPL